MARVSVYNGAMGDSAILLFSGGIDSTTALAWAGTRFAAVQALIFDYGQRHRVEVEMAEITARKAGVPFRTLRLPLADLLSSALVGEDGEIPDTLAGSRDGDGVPFTYVPFRNGIFLALAAAHGESLGIFDLVTGFNVLDTPDYPDTTPEFTAAMEAALNRGTAAARRGHAFCIHTPLIGMTKREILELGRELGADYSHAVSCYRGGEIPCGRCPSCEIRSRAFAEIGAADPLIERLHKEERL